MASVFKAKDRNGKPYKVWRFKYRGADGTWHYGVGWPDKQKTLDHAQSVEAEHRAIRAGEKPMPMAWMKNRGKPYSEIAAEYIAWGRMRGGRNGCPWDAQHAKLKETHLKWWQEKLGIAHLHEIALPAVEKELEALAKSGLKSKTIALTVEALRSLCNWSIKRGYLADNPLRALGKLDTRVSQPHRALTEDEVAKLLNVATPLRRIWYETALQTGYRAGELIALRVRDLDLSGPSLPLGAEFTKNRRAARQPITQALAVKLQELAGTREPEERLLGIPLSGSWKHIFKDYTEAGIPIETPEGKATWHSLRKVFVNKLIRSGADVKTVMELARHSAATMTLDVYASQKPELLRSAVEKAAGQLPASYGTLQAHATCCTAVTPEHGKAGTEGPKVLHLKDLGMKKVVGVTGARSNRGLPQSLRTVETRFLLGASRRKSCA
jgi:integrase